LAASFTYFADWNFYEASNFSVTGSNLFTESCITFKYFNNNYKYGLFCPISS